MKENLKLPDGTHSTGKKQFNPGLKSVISYFRIQNIKGKLFSPTEAKFILGQGCGLIWELFIIREDGGNYKII